MQIKSKSSSSDPLHRLYSSWRSLISVIILQLFFLFPVQSQVADQENFGVKVGVSIQLGSHIQRIGVMGQLYYFSSRVQVLHSSYVHFNRRNLGPKIPSMEYQLHMSFSYLWGDDGTRDLLLFDELSLMSPRKNSFTYNYSYYFDNINTSQPSGVLQWQFNRFRFAFRNDLFGGSGLDDKYRTGGLLLSYQQDSLLLTLHSTQWHGRILEGPQIKDPDYPSKHGYRDMTGISFGDISHGLLAFGIQGEIPYQQMLKIEVGLDAEQVRHALQNKLVHDWMLPAERIHYENAHYPMLQEDGSLYLFKEGQKVRKPKFYLQAGGNQPVFY